MKLIFMDFLVLLFLTNIEGSSICNCHCCRSDLCVPNFIGGFPLIGPCNGTTCNQNVCFGFNSTQCPAIGSIGTVFSLCSSSDSIFSHFSSFLMLIIFLFFIFLLKFN